MRISSTAVVRGVLALLLLGVAPPIRCLAQQDASLGEQTRVDLMLYFDYGHGVSGSHDAWLGGGRVGLHTLEWGVALAQQDWVTSLPCSNEPNPCDDPTSTTLGVERRIPGRLGAALIAGVDAGVFSVQGTHPLAGVRFGGEQAFGPFFGRIELQAQKVFGMNIATVGALAGGGFSCGGPRLPHR